MLLFSRLFPTFSLAGHTPLHMKVGSGNLGGTFWFSYCEIEPYILYFHVTLWQFFMAIFFAHAQRYDAYKEIAGIQEIFLYKKMDGTIFVIHKVM